MKARAEHSLLPVVKALVLTHVEGFPAEPRMRANDRPEAGIIGQQCRCDFSTVVQTVEEFPLIRLQREDEGEQVLARGLCVRT